MLVTTAGFTGTVLFLRDERSLSRVLHPAVCVCVGVHMGHGVGVCLCMSVCVSSLHKLCVLVN